MGFFRFEGIEKCTTLALARSCLRKRAAPVEYCSGEFAVMCGAAETMR